MQFLKITLFQVISRDYVILRYDVTLRYFNYVIFTLFHVINAKITYYNDIA